MMKFKILLFLIFAFAKAEFIIAQQNANSKVEQEERIEIEDFPVQARSLIYTISKARKKIKYYRETDGSLVTYEAKYKLSGHRYSVECDENGVLIDIEVRIKKRHIESIIFNKISSELAVISKRFNIEKIQKQYVIDDQDASIISNRLENDEFDNYEMIVAFKEEHKIYRKELLFSREGILLKQRAVKKLKYDFILF